jgi:hypothetical protein
MAYPPDCLVPRAFTLGMRTNAHREVSPYSYKQTAYDFMGGMWTATLDLHSLTAAGRATLISWLASLEGQKGTFEMKSLDYAGPFGVLTTNPTIAVAASARAKTVSLAMVSGEACVVADQITIAGHLHLVTAVAAPVSNVQAVTIWPRLRADVAVDDPVEALAPYGTWALAASETSYGLANKLAMSLSLDLIEAI